MSNFCVHNSFSSGSCFFFVALPKGGKGGVGGLLLPTEMITSFVTFTFYLRERERVLPDVVRRVFEGSAGDLRGYGRMHH